MAKNAERKRREERIAHLRRRGQALRNELESLETLCEREDAAPWIGKCFKYLNRDHSGEQWWLFLRIIGHDSANSFHTLQCQSQPGGWNIVTTRDHVYLLPDPKQRGYMEISRRQFDTAWNRYVERIKALNERD